MVLTITKGEVREIITEITSSTNDAFIIESATYDIYAADDKDKLNPLDSENCTVQGNKIMLLFDSSKPNIPKGQCVLDVTYKIDPEVLKASVIIVVK